MIQRRDKDVVHGRTDCHQQQEANHRMRGKELLGAKPGNKLACKQEDQDGPDIAGEPCIGLDVGILHIIAIVQICTTAG